MMATFQNCDSVSDRELILRAESHLAKSDDISDFAAQWRLLLASGDKNRSIPIRAASRLGWSAAGTQPLQLSLHQELGHATTVAGSVN